jgi:uncharacterized protein YfcZ (UPF0381/DUF406 family)
MNRDDIIRMAREAGFVIDEKAQQHQPNCIFHTHHMIDEQLKRFAALVRADEREACAEVCDSESTIEGIAQRCAAAIRARGQDAA